MAGTPPPRRQAPFILGLLLILAALPLGYFLFLRQPPPPPPPPPAPTPPPVAAKPPDKPVQMQINELAGAVEVRRAGGTWQELKPGMVLHASDSLRTQDGSSAAITSDKVRLELEPGTEMALQDYSETLSRLLLGSGMATVSVRTGTRYTIEVKAGGSDAVARTSEGTFTMSNDGAGTVAVGSREGEVVFEGNGKVVIVRAGQQSVVRPGSGGPSEPVKIPSSLLRKVQWPDKRQNKREVVVQGEAEPGTRLEIAGTGETFSPGKDGTFKRTVPLKEGENEVKIKAVSVGGTREEAGQKFLVDTKPPEKVKFKLPWDAPGGQAPPSPTP
jgi:hypothetical protein